MLTVGFFQNSPVIDHGPSIFVVHVVQNLPEALVRKPVGANFPELPSQTKTLCMSQTTSVCHASVHPAKKRTVHAKSF